MSNNKLFSSQKDLGKNLEELEREYAEIERRTGPIGPPADTGGATISEFFSVLDKCVREPSPLAGAFAEYIKREQRSPSVGPPLDSGGITISKFLSGLEQYCSGEPSPTVEATKKST